MSSIFDQQLNAYFDTKEVSHFFHNRMGIRCPICTANFEKGAIKNNPSFRKNTELLQHITQTHRKIMCEICLNHLKVFTYEMLCFTREVCCMFVS